MAEWINMPNFTTGEVMVASRFRQIVNNFGVLKNPNFSLNRIDETETAQTTTSTTLVDTTNALYTINLDTEGGDVLVFLGTNFLHSLAAGRVAVALKVDGVYTVATNKDDIHSEISTTEREMFNCAFLLENLTAGSHEIKLAIRSVDAGTTTLRHYRWSYFFAVELI